MKLTTILMALLTTSSFLSCTHVTKKKHFAETEGNGTLSAFYNLEKSKPSKFSILNDTELQFSGMIFFGDCQKLQQHLSSKPSIRKLVVTSRGGIVFEGVCMGDTIRKHNLDIQVNRECVSSCANYLFLSGNKKLISANSYVAYHGNDASSPKTNCDLEKEKSLEWKECQVTKDTEQHSLEEERQLLDKLSVKQEFFENPAVNKILKKSLFVPSLKYFNEYGITNIEGSSSLKICAEMNTRECASDQ